MLALSLYVLSVMSSSRANTRSNPPAGHTYVGGETELNREDARAPTYSSFTLSRLQADTATPKNKSLITAA